MIRKSFEKHLNNELTEFTLNWISDAKDLQSAWRSYLEYFRKKYSFLELTFDTIYKVYLDIGFSDLLARRYATHVWRLIEEDSWVWQHQPDVLYWLPSIY